MIASEGDAQRAMAAHEARVVAEIRAGYERQKQMTPAEREKEKRSNDEFMEFMDGTRSTGTAQLYGPE